MLSDMFTVRKPGCLPAVMVFFLLSTEAPAFDLAGTVFEKAARAYGLDPLLVYSVALVESAYGNGIGPVSPWPWTFGVTGKSFYEKSHDSAVDRLAELSKKYGKEIDVGMMQISIRWNGHRVSSPALLLDPETNVMIGAEILSEALRSSPDDRELGIGRYHVWKDRWRSREYGNRVLTVYRNLVVEEIQ